MSLTASLPQPLEPTIAQLLEALPEMVFDAETLPVIRELLGSAAAGTEFDGVTVAEHTVDEAAGVVLRVFTPQPGGAADRAAGPRPCLYWMHGGGFIIGNRWMDDTRLVPWAAQLDCVVVSVEYRLAPEHPFPAPLDDCYAGLTWVHEHADLLGVDPGRIGVGGLSAGAGLAASLAIRARDGGVLPVAFQYLDSPMLDDRIETSSAQSDWLVMWTRTSNRFGWDSYLGEAAGEPPVPAVPARNPDLVGLPPAFVVVGGADGFRDEDIEYATRLNGAGVPAELHVFPGMPHGFSVFAGGDISTVATTAALRWLGAQMGHAPSPTA
jgi:acetyl esterase/lipase